MIREQRADLVKRVWLCIDHEIPILTLSARCREALVTSQEYLAEEIHPLHLHFEFAGWRETEVVNRFHAAALVLGLIALAGFGA